MSVLEQQISLEKLRHELQDIESKQLFEQQQQLVQCGRNGNLYLAELLLDKGIPVDTTDINSMTALHWAVYSENAAAVSFFLNRGADPNAYSIESYDTPVSFAAKKGNVTILHYLLQHGGDIHYHDSRGVTLLMCAAASGSSLVVEYLVYLLFFLFFYHFTLSSVQFFFSLVKTRCETHT